MPISDLLAQISGDVQKPAPACPAPLKRKAESGIPRGDGKVLRTGDGPSIFSRPIAYTKGPSATPSNHQSASTAKHSSSPKPTISSGNGLNPSVDSSSTPAKPPKKGSYAEIMARGKAAQSTLGQIGRIQHKPIEKAPSRRERQEGRDAKSQAHRESNGNGRPNGKPHLQNGRRVAPEYSGKSANKASSDKGVPERKLKKAAVATTGYTGTARPNSSVIKSTSKPLSRSGYSSGYGSGPDKSHRSPGPSRRYTYASEAEDDEIDEEDYYSEASSDMEAATFEVDEEEERAARIARREDAEALKEENQLKQEKEEKRRRLAALAKTRR